MSNLRAMASDGNEDDLKNLIFDQLKCTICTDIFEKPTVTNCGHTFCKHCIEQWKNQNEKCPLCWSNIFSISSNHVLVGQIDEFTKKFAQEKPIEKDELKENSKLSKLIPKVIVNQPKIQIH